MYGVKHTLTFTRAGNDLGIYKGGAHAAIGNADDAAHKPAVAEYRNGKKYFN